MNERYRILGNCIVFNINVREFIFRQLQLNCSGLVQQVLGDEEGLFKLISELCNNENNNLFESIGNDLSLGEIEVIDLRIKVILQVIMQRKLL